MPIVRRHGLVGFFVFAVVLRAVAQPTILTVHHNANLRAQPSSQSAILDHLEPGDELTLEQPDQQLGFYKVRTETGIVGGCIGRSSTSRRRTMSPRRPRRLPRLRRVSIPVLSQRRAEGDDHAARS
jgi:hypothetical protein